jgi:hypothetical protein
MAPDQHREVTRPNNLRTALILGGVALFFFASVFVKFTWLS